jgi:hypothetical protein
MSETIEKAEHHIRWLPMTLFGKNCGNVKFLRRSKFFGGEWHMTSCRANLHRKHIDPLPTCKVCGMEDETTYRALTQCTFAVKFWDKLRTLTGIKVPKLCPGTWTRDLLDNSLCSEGDRGVIMCGMWSLWRSRNDRHHGKVPIDPSKALEWAIDTCSELANGFKVGY